jgi:hypothetical protein
MISIWTSFRRAVNPWLHEIIPSPSFKDHTRPDGELVQRQSIMDIDMATLPQKRTMDGLWSLEKPCPPS